MRELTLDEIGVLLVKAVRKLSVDETEEARGGAFGKYQETSRKIGEEELKTKNAFEASGNSAVAQAVGRFK